jgi:hypothetical protein
VKAFGVCRSSSKAESDAAPFLRVGFGHDARASQVRRDLKVQSTLWLRRDDSTQLSGEQTPSKAKPSEAKPSKAKPSKATQRNAKPSQAEQSKATQRVAQPLQTVLRLTHLWKEALCQSLVDLKHTDASQHHTTTAMLCTVEQRQRSVGERKRQFSTSSRWSEPSRAVRLADAAKFGTAQTIWIR